VGNIKLKFCALIIYTLFLLLVLFLPLSENCNAEEGNAIISILGEPTYKLNNTIVRDGRILGKTFQIDIVLVNTGNLKSDEIEINLTDEEGFSLSRRTYFEPGETKTISFTWSTINIRNQNLIVNYYPSDLDTLWNKYNSGSKTFTIKVVDSSVPGASTPGFEIIFLITALIVLTNLIKRKT